MAQSTSRTDSAGGVPGLPREGGGAPLSGRVVLLPRLKERDRIASALERAGARVLRAAVTRTVPGEAAALEATAHRIAAGKAAWLVLTSARTVEALAPYLLAEAGFGSAIWRHGLHQEPGTPAPHDGSVPPHTPITPPGQHQPRSSIPPMRVAVVGPATARAWTKFTGTAPDLVARGSAAALLKEPAFAGSPATGDHAPYQEPDIPNTHHGTPPPHAPARIPESKTAPRGLPGGVTGPHDSSWRAHASDDSPARLRTAPEAARRVLLPASALADPALADGLRRAGWEVEQVAAYTTVTADACNLPPDLEHRWATGGVDAVVLTAPSTTRAVLELLGPPPQRTGLVAIGATTAAATRKLGLTVAAVAPSPTPEGVLQATIDAIRATAGPTPPPQEPP
ncbi:uroporphyrinogen-III synthase [Actinomyces oris]|uniref:uroporphyrinogen-III synthase n=1 Tax=Actinomyces oris TaxID=544580 RepID=UPI0028895654|nr:uroporphyrinogen-III synthase [Actinomyces oris]